MLDKFSADPTNGITPAIIMMLVITGDPPPAWKL
jgi:hypothetical protein